MIRSRATGVLFGASPLSVRQLVLTVFLMTAAGLAWTVSMNGIEQLLSHSSAVVLWVGIPLVVVILSGVLTVYYDHGLILGWLAGTSFVVGVIYLHQDPTMTWYENLLGQAIVSGALAAGGTAVGGLLGGVFRYVRSSPSE